MAPGIAMRRVHVGERNKFAIEIDFETDPGPTPQGVLEAESFGAIALWVHGRNLTEHRVEQQDFPHVRWHLIGFLRWLRAYLEPLLNEEPFPRAIHEVSSGSAWFEASARPPLLLTASEEDAWFDDRQDWWVRHGVRAGADGGLLPHLLLRRLDNDLELSWDNERFPPPHRGVRFLEAVGIARVAVETAYTVFREVLVGCAAALGDAATALIPGPPVADPWRWLLAPGIEKIVSAQGPLAQRLRLKTLVPHAPWVARHCAETMVLSALPPTATEDTVRRLLGALALSDGGPRTDDSALRALCRPSKAPTRQPWLVGYEAARQLLRDATHRYEAGEDPGAWIRAHTAFVQGDADLGEAIDDACAWAPGHQPCVLRNRRGRYSPMFSLARALGHFVMDAEASAHYAHVSSPGEYWPSAARARAFAAMFLMPEEDVRAFFGGARVEAAKVRDYAARRKVTETTVLWHLQNLGVLDEEQRLSLV